MSSPGQHLHLNIPDDLLDPKPAPDGHSTREDWTYDHVPFLSELLPQWQGMPGYIYAQITTQNRRRAQDEGWLELSGAVVYTIRGPSGDADMMLLVRGRQISGQSPDSGARLCVVDATVEEATGLKIPRLDKSQTSKSKEISNAQNSKGSGRPPKVQPSA